MAALQDPVFVPGSNDAFYGPIPKNEQIFDIDFLEISPSPIQLDKFFFLLLRGSIPAHKRPKPSNTNRKGQTNPSEQHLLTNATLRISITCLDTDSPQESGTERRYTVPLRTTAFSRNAQLTIRDANTGNPVECLSSGGRSDIGTIFRIPGRNVPPGNWKIEVIARTGALDETPCLFAFTLTQRFDGRIGLMARRASQ